MTNDSEISEDLDVKKKHPPLSFTEPWHENLFRDIFFHYARYSHARARRYDSYVCIKDTQGAASIELLEYLQDIRDYSPSHINSPAGPAERTEASS